MRLVWGMWCFDRPVQHVGGGCPGSRQTYASGINDSGDIQNIALACRQLITPTALSNITPADVKLVSPYKRHPVAHNTHYEWALLPSRFTEQEPETEKWGDVPRVRAGIQTGSPTLSLIIVILCYKCFSKYLNHNLQLKLHFTSQDATPQYTLHVGTHSYRQLSNKTVPSLTNVRQTDIFYSSLSYFFKCWSFPVTSMSQPDLNWV